MSAREAAKHLGIQLRTLYAYVSRGAVRSIPGGRGRPRRYALADLERLRVRRDARLGHGAVAAGALRWGEPVLDSAITAITPRGPAYRGRVAVELAAAGARFENVAELLWASVLPDGDVRWPAPAFDVGRFTTIARGAAVDVMPLALALAAPADPDRADARPDVMIARARRIIPLLAGCLAWSTDGAPRAATMTRALGGRSISAIAARALGLADDAVPDLEVALVVLADHELNVSSFTARVTASAGADTYACVAAALATMTGPRHGRMPEEVARFGDQDPRAVLRALRKAGTHPPGFGHPLYPRGDPRATALLAIATRLAAAAPRTSAHVRRGRALLELVELVDTPPSVDVGLAAFVAALDLPPAAASGIFAVARSAGWIAHALEQRAAGFLLRPRARYVGVTPTS